MPAAANYTVSATFQAVDKFSSKLISMNRSTTSFATRTRASFARIEMATRRLERGVGRLMKKFGALGVMVGGAMIIGGITSMIGTFADFEQANASLSSVMATATQPQLIALQKDAMRLGSTTAKSATEVVGLQEAFARLGFETPSILKMTEATINGSVAMKGGLSDTAELVGAVINSFDKLGAGNTSAIIDQMTSSTQKSALSFEKLQTSLPIVSGAANAAGIPFNKLLALLGKLSDSGIDASSSANSLKNIFIQSAAKGLKYDEILAEIVKEQDQLTASTDKFGVRASVSGIILAKNLKETENLSEALLKQGSAREAAAKQLDTLRGRLTILGSAWEGFVLSLEKGNGKFATFLKTVVEVATEVLSLASGSGKLKESLSENELVIRNIAERVIKLGKVLGFLTAGYIALKIAIIATNAIMAVGKFLKFIGIFIKMARAQGLWTAAQWALNVAMNANPIGLIIMAIVALIAVAAIIILKWKEIVSWVKTSDNWFAKLIRNSITPLIYLFKMLKQVWTVTKEAFKSGKIGDFFKRIGNTIIDFVLAPLEMVLRLVNKMSGGKIGTDLLERVSAKRASLAAPEEGRNDYVTVETTNTAAAKESISRTERVEKSQAEILIKKEQGVEIESNIPSGFPITLQPTF